MNPAKFHRRWQRQRERLLDALRRLVRQCRTGGSAEEVHRLRVTLRRVRLLIRLGRPLFKEKELARFRAWAREVSRATNRVRDLDVAIEWLKPKPGTHDVVEALVARRERSWRAVRPRIRALPRAWLSVLGRAVNGRKADRRLAARCLKVEARLEDAVRIRIHEYECLSEAEQHEFRRTVRWWRYLREVRLARRRHADDGLLARLVTAQEAIGDLQNCEITRLALVPMKPSGLVLALRRSLSREQPARAREIRESLRALAQWMEWPPPADGLPRRPLD